MLAATEFNKEPHHILLLRGLVYLVTSWLIMRSLAGVPGLIGVLAAVPLGFVAGGFAAQRGLRGVCEAIGAVGFML